MSLVLDASVTIAWIFPAERTPAVQEVFARVARDTAFVPSLWHLEVANVLQMNIRRQRHDDSFRDRTLIDLARLPIETDDQTEAYAWTRTVDIASLHGLTVYDACYLELAQRRGCALATLDSDLRKAAGRLQVPLLGI